MRSDNHSSLPVALAALASVLAICTLATPTALAGRKEPPKEWDGLVLTEHKQVDYLYVLPGADLMGYKRIRLDPVEVAFDKNWDPNSGQRSPSRKVSKEDMEQIKASLAEEFRKVLREELAQSGYVIVDNDDEDVLRVTAAIANLYITAPDTQSSGRSRSYVASAGHMTLVAEMRDSVSGELLARAVDTVQGRETGHMDLANSVTNMGAARTGLIHWAKILREGLDDANGRSKK